MFAITKLNLLETKKITTDTTNILIRALSKRKKASRQVQHTTPNQRDRKGKRTVPDTLFDSKPPKPKRQRLANSSSQDDEVMEESR